MESIDGMSSVASSAPSSKPESRRASWNVQPLGGVATSGHGEGREGQPRNSNDVEHFLRDERATAFITGLAKSFDDALSSATNPLQRRSADGASRGPVSEAGTASHESLDRTVLADRSALHVSLCQR